MKRIALTVLALATLLSAGGSFVVPAVASAAPKDEVCAGIGEVSGSGQCKTSGPSLTSVVRTVVNIFSLIVGVAAVIMVMFAGFKYITSGGDASNIASAKNTLIYAVVGLVVVALAQAIVKFVLNKIK